MTDRESRGGVPETVRAEAEHGSFCPKLCNFACPVVAATGRSDALPWSFHRTVADLATGRLPLAPATATRLEACSGCLACRVPCDFDQDVPAQVRAGRAALARAGAAPPAAGRAREAVAAGRSPYGELVGDRGDPETVEVVVVAGCRDDHGAVDGLTRLLRAAGDRAAVVAPDGCCGGALEDLGLDDDATDRRDRLAGRLRDGPSEVLVLDPHCLPSVRAAAPAGAEVSDAVAAVAARAEAGRLVLAGGAPGVTYHDPCLSARRDGVVAAPRTLLGAAGAPLVEPEWSGISTSCSGAGLALDLLAPEAAAAVAARRATGLAATEAVTLTACSAARRRLAEAGAPVHHLFEFLADQLPPERAP